MSFMISDIAVCVCACVHIYEYIYAHTLYHNINSYYYKNI